MKMIDVLNLQAESKIDFGTELIVTDKDDIFEYINYKGGSFIDEYGFEIDVYYTLDKDFLNLEVKLTPPKEKKYLIKINVRGLNISFGYLNYYEQGKEVTICGKTDTDIYKTHFTKKEMQSIQPVREFLEDMEGKYELIEVEDNAIY